MSKLYLLLVPLFRAYGFLLYTQRGHNVTLQCYDSNVQMSWYKQVAGEQPQIISSVYRHSLKPNTFYNQFKNDKRFSVEAGGGFYHLKISKVQDSDSAMYFCGQTTMTGTEFKNGIYLFLNETSRRSFLQQPASDSAKPGDSVTLSCTLQTGTSYGDHSVYWFKKDSGSLGILYIHTHSSSQCAQSHEAPAQCVFSLSKRNVSLSDAGTYYCAVASCGEILFGNGTRLDVGEKHEYTSPLLMFSVVVTLLASVILNMILISILCKMSRRRYLEPEGLHHQTSVPDDTTDIQNEESDDLQYVALDIKKRQSKSRRQRSTEEETIYSRVARSDM